MFYFFFFSTTATTEIYTLSLHDALPISPRATSTTSAGPRDKRTRATTATTWAPGISRSEEHTSELQSRFDLVCRLLLEKKKNIYRNIFFLTIVDIMQVISNLSLISIYYVYASTMLFGQIR